MRPIYKMNVIQIEITNACIHQCANCTRFCGHHTKPFFMDIQTFKKAVDSMHGFPGMLGIMGGEPTIHPEFEKLVDYYASHWHPQEPLQNDRSPIRNMGEYIIENDLQNWSSKRGLWTSLGLKYYQHFETIQDIFEFQLVNDHTNPGLHQSMLISRKELNIPDSEWLPLRDNCWAQNSWSASITPKGAFFCEVAAALDMLFDGPGGWPIEAGWWKREPKDFGDQLNWCELCGACLNVPRVPANSEIDVVSPDLYKKLQEINSPKLNKGQVNILEQAVTDQSGCTYSSEWYLPEGDNTKRISPTNSTLLPKSVTILNCLENKRPTPPATINDWIFLNVANKPIDEMDEFTALFKQWIFNPGCLYIFKEATIYAFNVKAKAIREIYPDCFPETQNWLDMFISQWDTSKVIRLKNLDKPGNIEGKLTLLSQLEKQQTELMTAHVLTAWQMLSNITYDIALFGCGQHTTWLLSQLKKHALPLPAIIIDDNPHHESMSGIPVISSADFKPNEFKVLVISSDIHAFKMTETASKRWQKMIPVINFYSHFANPYFQK